MPKVLALVGNPNSGKSTLFNSLTGSNQKVGNWPGVTVECKKGYFQHHNETIEVVDLPGTYSLTVCANESALDERIACDFILNNKADVIVNVIDANHLERNLYLTTQLLEMGVPLVVAINMVDSAEEKGIFIDANSLAKKLGCAVVLVSATKNTGLAQLKEIISCAENSKNVMPYPPIIQDSIDYLSKETHNTWQAIKLLENDFVAEDQWLEKVTKCQETIQNTLHEDTDVLLAEARYQWIQNELLQCIKREKPRKKEWTEKLDKYVLNRWLGIPIFLSIIYCLFFFAIAVGGKLQTLFDSVSAAVFVDGTTSLLSHLHASPWLIALLANGLGKGLNTIIAFIPVMGLMFLFLAVLEDSGYMARAAFVVDRFMQLLGLPGKAFVPMIIGFGCNVPAVMAARTLENRSDRILTIMMSPFMSCGARLAIYAVFVAAFFPTGGYNIVFFLYLIGISMAMLTGFLLRKTVLKGEISPLVLELPDYHVPQIKSVFLGAWQRLKGFVFRAGKYIVPICIVLGVLNTLSIHGNLNTDGGVHSILATIGQMLTPIFAPMGIHPSNWPAVVGLLTGTLAKEVVIGTLNSLYSQLYQFASLHPQQMYGVLFQQFDGKIGAFAYLLFVLLYFPCISTTAVIARELNKKWAFFSVCWSTGVAYCVAVLFYQIATFALHPALTFVWSTIIGIVLGLIVTSMKLFNRKPLLEQSV